MELRAEKVKENNRKQDAERAKKRGDREAREGGICVASVAMRFATLHRETEGFRFSSEPSRTEKNGSGRLGKSVRRRRFFL